MANRSDDPEFHARIIAIDARTPSPTQRAERVWNILQTHDPDLTTWDVLCFCAEFIALNAERYHWIVPLAKKFVSLVYSAHYYDETRVDSESDRITRKVEPEHSSDGTNASPKSLFDVHRTDAPRNDGGGRDSTPETPLHIRDSTSPAGETSSPPDAGKGVSGDASSPA